MGDRLKWMMIFALCAFVAAFVSMSGGKAFAACGWCTPGGTQMSTDATTTVETQLDIAELQIKAKIQAERIATQVFMEQDVWNGILRPSLEAFADQMSAVAMQQVMAIGMFLDAKQQLETQRTLQTIRARAHKDYQPSAGLCEFGSSIKSLAASERKAELAAHVLSQRSQDRNTRNANTSSATQSAGDMVNRLEQYKRTYCDTSDNNGGLKSLCETADGTGAQDPKRMNMDIDYTRAMDVPWTIDVDFTDNQLTDQESDVFALANNLYSFDIFSVMTQYRQEQIADAPINVAHAAYLNARAMMAKRSVAENSFNAIMSMKSAGTAGSRDFLEAILRDLGVSDTAQNGQSIDDVTRMLGYSSQNNDAIGPSYYAQMEVLTKKIYQNPDFYTNLYDTPANVERKQVAMQAIGLMQKFDLFKSYLRTEASLSVLLETSVEEIQNQAEDRLSKVGR